jgi:hypothetical protein
VNGRPDALCDGGVQQIRSDGGGGVDAERQHQQRRHQRTAANPGQADQKADKKSGHRIQWIDRHADDQPPRVNPRYK